MKKQHQDVISKYMGVDPIMINSALVSAQNRQRLYWTNIPNVTQPEDRGILLKDIIERGVVDREKSYCIDANSAAGRQYGLSEKGLVEAACVIDLFGTLCTLAKGFRLAKRNF